MEPVPSTITKTYPRRGPLQQFRFAATTAFRCFRCGNTKKSKLITIYANDWARRLCNGCYGRLLSLYEIKAGTSADDQRAEQLALALLSLVAVEDQREAERLYRTAERRAQRLSPEAVRFIATAEHVARQLQAVPQLEWSPAVIGLCKAVEVEVLGRVLLPLVGKVEGLDLTADRSDRDIGRIAAFCMDPTQKPPELGAMAHFLQTVIHSRQRRETSALIQGFLRLAGDWTGSDWLLNPAAFHASLQTLLTVFRNRAAHTDELAQQDYLGCRELTIGSQGILWKLLLTTKHHK